MKDAVLFRNNATQKVYTMHIMSFQLLRNHLNVFFFLIEWVEVNSIYVIKNSHIHVTRQVVY